MSALQERTAKVARAADPIAEAGRLWSQQENRAFGEIRRKLREMAPGIERCMYCEDSEGTDIEHFWPKARYPERAFDWDNYLFACSACNSNHKREQFPMKEGQPLLINPVEDQPHEHLSLSPGTGEYVSLTDRGDESVKVFGLQRYTLVQGRRDAWVAVQIFVCRYADACQQEDTGLALDMQRVLCRYPHASVFAALLSMTESPAASTYIDPRCLAALAAHPEIRGWLG